MAGNRFGTRLRAGVREPWALLLSAFGGGAVWAVGGSIPLSVATASVMLGTAATVGAFTRSREEVRAQLRPGTRQHRLITLLDGHVRSLRALRTEALSGVVQSKAEDAVAAADAARPSVLQVAAAVDALDAAISAARRVSGHGEHATESIKNTVGRLRRDGPSCSRGSRPRSTRWPPSTPGCWNCRRRNAPWVFRWTTPTSERSMTP